MSGANKLLHLDPFCFVGLFQKRSTPGKSCHGIYSTQNLGWLNRSFLTIRPKGSCNAGFSLLEPHGCSEQNRTRAAALCKCSASSPLTPEREKANQLKCSLRNHISALPKTLLMSALSFTLRKALPTASFKLAATVLLCSRCKKGKV